MQEVHEPGRRPGQQFAGVDLRRPKGYAAAPGSLAAEAAAGAGDPCPRCDSRDTKFCYYNNYNTAQPRHFCKGCRRYWTKGGTLRNVPVGGGTRKKPASSSSASASSPSSPAPSAKPKKPYKKKRRVAPPEPSATPVKPVAADSAKVKTETTTTTTTTTTTPADAASEITTELMAPAVEDESLAQLLQPDDAAAAAAVALGLGLSDLPAGKGLGLDEPDSFEWPPAFDLGAYWGNPAAFADPDPAVFLNLP